MSTPPTIHATEGVGAAPVVRRRPGGRRIARALRRHPAAAVGIAILLAFSLIGIFAPLLEPYSTTQHVGPSFGHPSLAHPLGLDDGGIDIVSLLIAGTRTSLLVGAAAALVATLLGGTVGIVAGYFGGLGDTILMRITDFFLVVPYVPLMIVIAAVWGPSLSHIILVIGLLLWTNTAYVVRAQTRSVRERVFVSRVRALGASNRCIVFQHVLPHVAPLVIASTVLTIAGAIFAETALAFLGLGDPTAVSWGTMIEHAFQRTAISAGAWWAIVPPGLCVGLVIIGAYLAGQGIEDALNPRLRSVHLSARSFRVAPRPAADEPG
jgi:peptide/nickel transport system permease protein